MSDNNNRIGWDYTFTAEDSSNQNEDVILPPGKYFARITRMERAQFAGSTTMCASPMAKIYLAIDGGHLGRGFAIANIILNQKVAWKIETLALSCGFWKRGEGKGRQMPWGELAGRECYVEIKTREYNGKIYQDVDRFLAWPENADALRAAPISTETPAVTQVQTTYAPMPVAEPIVQPTPQPYQTDFLPYLPADY